MRWPAALLAFGLGACGDDLELTVPDAPPPDTVLVFTRTLGYRHDEALAVAPEALRARMLDRGIETVDTEDPAAFTPENLARFRAVVFLFTSGNDILDESGKAALEDYVRGGGGWMGVHSAADTEYEWPFYREMIVAHFRTHPVIQPAQLHVEAPSHPAMQDVPIVWDATDEWYDFTDDVRAITGVTVLATIDEASYTGGSTGPDHPMIWAHTRLGGRVLYAEPGHVAGRWTEPEFLAMIEHSLRWVMRRE